MWIFLNDAFLSLVAHRDRPGYLMVRARARGDIERVFPGVKVSRTPDADYLFRAVVSAQEAAIALAARVQCIDYPNFKGSVAETDRHDAYMDVWQAMHGWQYRRALGENAPPRPLALFPGDTFAHTTRNGPRTVRIRAVSQRALERDPWVELEYLETGARTTMPCTRAQHLLRNAERL